MKKRMFSFIFLLIIILFSSFSFAEPLLTCDPQPDAANIDINNITYDLIIDSTIVATGVPAESDTSVKIDLAPFNIPDGTHILQLRIKDKLWNQVTDWSIPLEVKKTSLKVPIGLNLKIGN